MSNSNSGGGVRIGIGFGTLIAAILSWSTWHSVLWLLVNAFFGWFYVIWWLIFYHH